MLSRAILAAILTLAATGSSVAGQRPVQQNCAALATPSVTAASPCGEIMPRIVGRGSKLPPPAAEALQRADAFRVVYRHPASPSGDTLVLLHGSGGDETTLTPLARRIAPHAMLVGIGGRVVQDGKRRWYRRITPTSFDQDDVRREAEALYRMLMRAADDKTLDLARTTFVGYSNGANLLAAMSVLHPGLIRRAVLLRPMAVLDDVPAVSLEASRFLMVVGAADKVYAPFGPALETMLRTRGAVVDALSVGSGHGIGERDVEVVRGWMASLENVSLNR